MPNGRLNALAIMSMNRSSLHEIDTSDEVPEKFIPVKNRETDFCFEI